MTETIQWAYMATAFIALVMHFLIALSLEAQLIVLIIGSVLTGISHGALDFKIAQKLGLAVSKLQSFLFLSIYMMIAGINFLIWLQKPEGALLFFLGLSILHFGYDWIHKESKPLINACRLLTFGISFLCLPSLFYGGQLQFFFGLLSSKDFATDLVYWLQSVGPFCLTILGGFLVIDLMRNKYQYVLLAAIFSITALLLPPLLSLACYFCLLHAPLHFLESYRFLDPRNVNELLKHTVPLSMITLVLMGLVFVASNDTSNTFDDRVLWALIVSIACLTTPHMIIIGIMSWQKTNK